MDNGTQSRAAIVAALVDALAEHLRGVESFEEAVLRERYGSRYKIREFRRGLWEAKQRLRRETDTVFVPVGGRFVRATEEQKMNAAQRTRRRGFKAIGRSVDILESVDESRLTSDGRDRLQAKLERYGLDLIRGAQLDALRRALPSTCDLPDVPRGDRRT